MDDNQTPNPPRDVLRDGRLKSTIWRNEGEKGPFYSVNLARVYRDRQGDLRDSQSFAGADMLRVSELARKSYDRTQELRREDLRESRDEAPLLERQGRSARRDAFKSERSQSNRPPRERVRNR